MPIFYWQVIGWRSHVTRLPNSAIPRPTEHVADILWDYLNEDGVLTLTLGIAPCGASYLLTPATPEMDPELRALFCGQAWPATRFVSLSPVEFRDVKALHAKLVRHQQKSKKKNKRNEPDRDYSQANTHFATGGPWDVLTTAGRNRAVFEYHRLFYRLCRASIDSAEYNIKRVPFFDNIRAFSFACTFHEPSTWRPHQENRSAPVILDLGLTEWILPASSMDMTAIGDQYYTIKENALLQNPRFTRGSYMYGEPQAVTHDELRTKLAETFARNLAAPMLLFVRNTDAALDVLRYYGVDTSDWSRAFEPLVGKDPLRVDAPVKNEFSQDRRGRYNDRDAPRAKSERSRSPQRRGAYAPRPRSPPPQENKYPVYVVDVRQLHATMRSMPPSREPVLSLAEELGARLEVPDGAPPFTVGQWCAGNECRLVALIWRALASGNAIDEQYGEMQARPRPAPASAPAVQPPPAAPTANWDDDDVDPNDIVVARPPPGQLTSNPYDDFESDDYEAD